MSSASDLAFDAERHEYRLAGERVPHVTGILKDAGLVDASRFTEWSRERGIAVHLACQLDDEGDLDDATVDPRIAGYVAAWRRFRSETGFAPSEIERRVLSRIYRYCGRLDVVGMFRSVLAVLDRKTGAPYPVTGVQLAAYARAYHEETGVMPSARWAVHLAEDGTYTLVQYRDPNDWKVFLAALTVANWRREHVG